MRVGLDPERGLLILYWAEQSLGPAAEEIHGRRANPASWPGAVLADRNGGRSLKGFQHLSRAAGVPETYQHNSEGMEAPLERPASPLARLRGARKREGVGVAFLAG